MQPYLRVVHFQLPELSPETAFLDTVGHTVHVGLDALENVILRDVFLSVDDFRFLLLWGPGGPAVLLEVGIVNLILLESCLV